MYLNIRNLEWESKAIKSKRTLALFYSYYQKVPLSDKILWVNHI